MPLTIRRIAPFAAIVGIALFAMACTRIGQGDLHVANDLSGLGADNTTLQAFVADEGDPWPHEGDVSLWVKGDDFGDPPEFNFTGPLYLVRTEQDCPMTEAGPEVFHLDDVTITGVVTVFNGSVSQMLTMSNTPANRVSTWALIEIGEFPDTGGGHLIHRCGTVTWNP